MWGETVKTSCHIYRGFHLQAPVSTHTILGCVTEGSLPMSTNNNTASRHKLSPGEPVAKLGLQTIFETAAVAPKQHIIVINKHPGGLYL